MTEPDEPGGTPHAAPSLRPAESERPAATPSPLPSMTAWGRRAALVYLGVGALALAAMAIETVLGHPGIGSMFAAFLSVPWSMLVAGFAPPLPRDWPLAAGLAVRMLPLALFMLLNAAIVAGIAARSERDLTGRGTKAVVLVLLASIGLSSGCALRSRQVVMVAAPSSALLLLGGVNVSTVLQFDLSTVPAWNRHRGNIREASELTLMGDYSAPGDGPFGPSSALDVEIAAAPGLDPVSGTEPTIWGNMHMEKASEHRVDWYEGMARMKPAAALLRREVAGDGQFTLIVRSILPLGALGGATVENFRLGTVLEVR